MRNGLRIAVTLQGLDALLVRVFQNPDDLIFSESLPLHGEFSLVFSPETHSRSGPFYGGTSEVSGSECTDRRKRGAAGLGDFQKLVARVR